MAKKIITGLPPEEFDLWDEFDPEGLQTITKAKTGLSLPEAKRRFDGIMASMFSKLQNVKECMKEHHNWVQAGIGEDVVCVTCGARVPWAAVRTDIQAHTTSEYSRIGKENIAALVTTAVRAEDRGVSPDKDTYNEIGNMIKQLWPDRKVQQILMKFDISEDSAMWAALVTKDFTKVPTALQTVRDISKSLSRQGNLIQDKKNLLITLKMSEARAGITADDKEEITAQISVAEKDLKDALEKLEKLQIEADKLKPKIT